MSTPFLDGYCSTVQGLLDWFEVDLGFTELLFIQIDLCVVCVFVLGIVSTPAYNIRHKRGGGLGSRPKKMYGERLGDGVEYHLMSPTPRH